VTDLTRAPMAAGKGAGGVRQIAAFVLLTFALSWGAWGLAILTGSDAAILRIAGTFGPTLAALILAGAAGRAALRHLLGGFSRWRAPARVWAFALGATAAVGFAALGIEAALGGTPDWPGGRALLIAPVVFLWVLLFSVAGEETGWRGYLLPKLLERTGPVRASLALGLVWALWHLPLWAMPGDFHAAIPDAAFRDPDPRRLDPLHLALAGKRRQPHRRACLPRGVEHDAGPFAPDPR
jgi:uncharacterized protein